MDQRVGPLMRSSVISVSSVVENDPRRWARLETRRDATAVIVSILFSPVLLLPLSVRGS